MDRFTSGSSSGHSSSDHSSSGHSISGHSLYGYTPPDTTIADSSAPLRFVYPPLARTLWCSESYRHWRFAPLSTMSPAATVTSSIHASRALVPSRVDLLLPRKGFRDYISLEDSDEEDIDADMLADIKADATAVEVAVDTDVEAGIDVGIDMEVDVGVDVEYEFEDEVESSDRVRKRVGPLPTHRLIVRHSVDYSSSDHFSLDDSSRDSSSSSSLESSLYSSADALSDSASSRSSSDHSLPTPSLDHLMILLLRALLARGVDPLLHLYHYLHLPLEHCLMFRGTDLEMDFDVKRSDGIKIDPEVQAEIDECFAYADALEIGGVIESFQRDQGHKIIVTRQQSADMLERIGELEQDNRRLRDMMDVATTSPFLSSIDDSSDSDIPDTPPSPTHGTLFTETILSTQSTPVASGAHRRRVMVLTPGQPIPHGRPYHYHLNGPVHMTTARKMVVPLPTHRLAMRHSVDYSSSDHFASDDSSRDSSSSSLSETSSDPSSDDLSDSSTDHSLPAPSSGMRPSHHLRSLLPSIPRLSTTIFDRQSHDSSSVSPSRKRSRSPVASVLLSSPIPGALEAGLGVDIGDECSEPSRYRGTDLEIDDDVLRCDGIDIDPENQAKIDKCIAYADALRDIGIDARVVVEAVDREEIEIGTKGLVEVRVDRVTHPVVADDIPKPAQERAVEVTYETLGDLVKRFHDHTKEIPVHRVQAIESVLEGSRTKDQSDRTAEC
ncbi:hypothetical protein Tco_1570696 [Tanacetum coccineum]